MKTSRTSPLARTTAVLALAITLALAGCGGGQPPEGQAAETATTGPDGKPVEKKAPAVPVEVARVTKQVISASYSGTASLEAPAEAQVVAKASGVVLQVLVEEGDQVLLDGNHPLAGQELTFTLNVIDVKAASAEEIAHGHAHGAHGHHH